MTQVIFLAPVQGGYSNVAALAFNKIFNAQLI